MNRIACAAAGCALLASSAVFAQDIMQFGLPQLKVAAEDAKVRVLHYTPKQGDKTPMHSHLSSVVYVIKGGRIRYTMPDGSVKVATLKTGETLLRPPVTHADEALDAVEVIIMELKQ